MTATRGAPPWRPRWLPVVAMLAVLPVLLWLGAWQLERAAQKRELFERFEAAAAPVPYERIAGLDPEEVRYRRVLAAGSYDPQRQFLLEGMTRAGRPGLHVLTPLALDDGSYLIVDRGWIPETRTRDANPELPLDGQRRTVAGRTVPFYAPGLRLAAEPSQGWPRRVLYPTPQQLAEALDAPVAPHLLWLEAAAPDGFARDFKPAEFGPARHIGYAVQWFGLAITLVLIYVVLRFRRSHGH